jgi:hypothetical protein
MLYNLLICNLSELMINTLHAYTNNPIALLEKTTCSYFYLDLQIVILWTELIGNHSQQNDETDYTEVFM